MELRAPVSAPDPAQIRDPRVPSARNMGGSAVLKPTHHFPGDILRAYAIGSASEGTRLSVACHLAFCAGCGEETVTHGAVMDRLLEAAAADPAGVPGAGARDRLLASLPPQAPAARVVRASLPRNLPPLPAPLLRQLELMGKVAWRRLLPGIRAIDLGIETAWRARLLSFRPGIPIPVHDHGGPEHTVVFAGGLDDESGHLGRGDAATMMPGETHQQRSSPGEPCIALVVNEAAPMPLTLVGRVLKGLTRS
jgi:putative transcriptional regulator